MDSGVSLMCMCNSAEYPRKLPKGQDGKWNVSPQFWAHVYSGQMAGWIKMPLGTDIGLGPAPPKKGGHSPLIFGHVYCGQTAGYIRIPLGGEVGFGPGDIVLNGDPAPPVLKYRDCRELCKNG